MKTRVLIVDDEEKFSEPLAERLALRDYDVTTSNSGEDAVAKVKQYNYDVVVLDVLMPGMSGIETLKAMKEIKPLTEIIMLTGHATVEAAVEGMKLGASDFLMKPCETEDLISKIEKAHDRKAERDDRIREAKAQDIIASPRSVLKK